MKKLIILLLFISTIALKNTTSGKNRKKQYAGMQPMHKKHPSSKEKPLLQRTVTKVISDCWDVLIAHAKRWYTALAIFLIIWYKSGIPFPFRSKIASYLQ